MRKDSFFRFFKKRQKHKLKGKHKFHYSKTKSLYSTGETVEYDDKLQTGRRYLQPTQLTKEQGSQYIYKEFLQLMRERHKCKILL